MAKLSAHGVELWREERITSHAERINAGYIMNAMPVESPVYINGVTAW